MREKPPLGDLRILDFMGVTTTEFAKWVVSMCGPVVARQIAERITREVERESEEA